MRLFVALNIPPEIAEKIARVRQALIDTKADVRWVDPRNFHLTIKFLGETDDALIPKISERLTAAAGQVPAFPLEVEGLGRFPEKGPARVIMSRIVSPDNRLIKLHRLIDTGLAGIGLPLDMRPLNAHLTLGRVNSNHALNRLLRLLDKHDLDFFGAFNVERASLYQSTLTPTGSVYRVLHTADLAPRDGRSGALPEREGRDLGGGA